ncbi:response regulator [Stutzerimonas zhaodongensis]|uniref:response regulator n=1 Tax=Stutzerimonas zhaodongensis TaxID=1176257 RepID=UPI0021044A3E|nr:response regulator [Stutzerimonas zhaodongensis]MCQ2030401.1 response regulator [Stutzerimonas zhaodongensis]
MSELKRILHVEDDPSIQAVVKVALEAIGGYQVRSCSSGQQALDEVEGFAPQFILLDVMMPGMGGPETLSRLGELIDLGQIPVVFMTAKVQPSEIESLRRLGARDVIVKPFDPMRLAGQIQAIWDAGGAGPVS